MSREHEMDVITSADDGAAFDPTEAATLLDETGRRARRELDVSRPLVLAARGVGVLIAYGAVWWSVRDQHPYEGPRTWALVVLYAIVAGIAVSGAVAAQRAT